MEKISFEVGDVVRVSLDPTVGDEKKKESFCLVIEKGNSHLNLIIILPNQLFRWIVHKMG
jgi:mRNA-degrading endonuclease toxin of MazEF toxin-antitoxin module